MSPPVITILVSLPSLPPTSVLGLAIAAIGGGSLVCLITGDDEDTGAAARRLLGLVAGGGLALGCAKALATLVPALLPLA
jgi:hypothetical protein